MSYDTTSDLSNYTIDELNLCWFCIVFGDIARGLVLSDRFSAWRRASLRRRRGCSSSWPSRRCTFCCCLWRLGFRPFLDLDRCLLPLFPSVRPLLLVPRRNLSRPLVPCNERKLVWLSAAPVTSARAPVVSALGVDNGGAATYCCFYRR